MFLLFLPLLACALLLFWGWFLRALWQCFSKDGHPSPWALAIGGFSVVWFFSSGILWSLPVGPAGAAVLFATTPLILMSSAIQIPWTGFLYWLVPMWGLGALGGAILANRLGAMRFAVAASFFTGSLAAFAMAEPISRQAMCRVAITHGATEIHRSSVHASLRETQYDIANAHAWFSQDGQVYIWSYREMNFLSSLGDPRRAPGSKLTC